MIKSPIVRVICSALVVLIPIITLAQDLDMTMGRVTAADLSFRDYPNDTSASAVVLNELGRAWVSDEDVLIFDYYVKIKILDRRGFRKGDFEIRLHKNDTQSERALLVEATTYNLENGRRKETKMDPKAIFKQDDRKYSSVVKFTLPDLREGSVIEIKYQLSSPFKFNFRSWEFQSDLPKVHSEYWAQIPANYIYHISLKGFYKLSKNESSIVQDCFHFGSDKANCALMKYAMDNIPAFREEEYMTAESNFLSAVHFELSEVNYFDGRILKRTKEWKDVDIELRTHDEFGDQIRKAGNLWEAKVKSLTSGLNDDLEKAKAIYDFMKNNFLWTGVYGIFTDLGVKQTFETKKGNAADINLSLVGALKEAGLDANPVILSSRENGLPVDLFPVITDFNYVIGAVDIAGKRYLLDATNALQPFGFLPMRCLNGKGRLMAKESSWTELKPKDKKKSVTSLEVTLTKSGVFIGKATSQYLGYAAFSKRTEILESRDTAAYRKKLEDRMTGMTLTNLKIDNLMDLDKPLVEKMDFKLGENLESEPKVIYFDPFLFGKITENPFKSADRLYPVDFGSPMEEVLSLNLINGSGYQVDEVPTSVALALPQGGGRYLFNVSSFGDHISITSNLTINKGVYSSEEYHFLKELFSRIVQINQSPIVLKRK